MSTDPGGYNYGLSEDEEERAARLHRDAIIIDLVAQHVGGSNIFSAFSAELLADLDERLEQISSWEALTETEYWPYEMSAGNRSHLIRDWYMASGLTCGTYGVGVHDGNDPTCLALDRANQVFGRLPWILPARNACDIRRAKAEGKIALYAQWQPFIPTPRSLDAIDDAYRRGLRSFMLTYNRMDVVGVGCTERVDAGLSAFGVDLLRRCEALGIMVDVSHCGRATTLDACEVASRPVNANHTAARAIFDHARCKTDEELRAVAATGGVIGVVAVPAFLTRAAGATIDLMLDQIEYIAELVGWRHVALGTDWPMQAPMSVIDRTMALKAASIGFRPEDRLDLSDRLKGYEDGRDLPNITRGLVARGFEDTEILGILGGNALRIIEDICG